jgi:transcriptional regulator with XRE-family HTH domain
MSQEDIFINGELLRLRREARGWTLSDMATRACMSVKQIRQLEEGGVSCFYSVAVKATSAKKVGTLLGLSPEEVFAHEVESVPEQEAVEDEIVVTESDVAASESNLAETAPLVQEAAHNEVDTAITDASAAPEPVVEEPKSKASLWVIAALFGAALGVAAYMQPQDESVLEAAPPLQAVPADVADPASAASGAEVTSSSPELVVLPASAAVVPVASGVPPVTVRPASSSIATPASPAASKAP